MTTTPVNFKVRTQANAYTVGYQDAMKDIAAALEANGIEGVQEWLNNNTVR
jgi:hypothetical protein